MISYSLFTLPSRPPTAERRGPGSVANAQPCHHHRPKAQLVLSRCYAAFDFFFFERKALLYRIPMVSKGEASSPDPTETQKRRRHANSTVMLS